ncbi:MAG: SRPBCC family protein [Bryobacterales bacterium]|nr:SRPBCC family protein [Bryobacterales bacterium]
MLQKLLIGLVGVVGVLAGVVAMQPAQFEVVRKGRVPGSPEKVFGMVNDFRQWNAWSPWEKLDPAMKRTFSGAASGAGASYGWVGNSDVGEGRMTIEESRPHEHIRIKLEFIKPFAATNVTEFRFTAVGNEVEVEWRMSGENNFISKAFCLVMGGMDKMIGPDFEKGLAQMRAAAGS